MRHASPRARAKRARFRKPERSRPPRLRPCVESIPGLTAHLDRSIQPWTAPASCPGSSRRRAAADAKDLADFGRLVGSWDLDVVYHHDDGRIEHRPGEWHFAWILEGRAIQDVWRVPGAGPGDPLRGYGTTIRVWDPELGAWRVTWVSGLGGGQTSFIASAIAGEIVMESQGEDEIFRWIFSDITTTASTGGPGNAGRRAGAGWSRRK